MGKSSPYKGRFRIKYPYMIKDNSYAAGYHCGVDLTGLDSKDIYPIDDGKIIAITTNDAYGNSVVQSLPDGLHCRYSHLTVISCKVGDKVVGGMVKIGVEGSTGRSTGSHLDIRISKHPYHTNNPKDYFSVPEYLGFPNQDELIVDWNNLEKGEDDMLDNLVIYADGDTGAALIKSQSLGCPMVHKNSAEKYQAAKKHWIGVQGSNDNSNYYYAGANRLETAKKVL